MASQQLAPLANPLPNAPADEPFTSEQWTTFMSIMDTVIPSIRREAAPGDMLSHQSVSDVQYDAIINDLKTTLAHLPDSKSLDAFLDEKPSDNAEFQGLLKRSLLDYAREDARRGLAFILSVLNSRLGSLILTGSTIPIHLQPVHVRTSILEKWRVSYIPVLQNVYKQMTLTGKNIFMKTSSTIYGISDCPRVPDQYKPGRQYDYEFIQFSTGSSPEVIETDVVIVGSGCGGAVCAKNIAEAGHRVMVVDKSYYYPPQHLPMSEIEGGVHLFENGGSYLSDDGSISVIAASNWGGGGSVNWSASLQTQGYVRNEWARDRGLTFFNTAEFQKCLDRVCDRMGVSTDHIRHNHSNQLLLEGSRKLGYHAKAVPQNTGGNEHYCGHCTLGCGSAQKQGPNVTWLPDAAKAGSKFIEGFKIEKVLFEESGGQKRAVGVKGLWTSRNSKRGVDGPLTERTVREIIVKAKKVIVSCGSLWSPIVLLNSGLNNPNIGRNLYLHPVNLIAGVYREDVRPWEGSILTAVNMSFENLDGHSHGVKLEATCMMPSWCLSFMNWKSGLDFKLQALKYRHSSTFIALTRDRDTGRVYADPGTGLPRIQYTPSKFDRAHTLTGILALAKIIYITGAEEIHVGITGTKPFIRNPSAKSTSDTKADIKLDEGVSDARFQAWLKYVESVGNVPPAGTFGSAHQMGTNRMSARADAGVVDPAGRVWGTQGLYIADASVFPSASGVNPMITNMAISDWTSRGVAAELAREKSRDSL